MSFTALEPRDICTSVHMISRDIHLVKQILEGSVRRRVSHPSSNHESHKKSLDCAANWKVYTVRRRGVMAMDVKQKISLCPECSACPEVEILHDEGRPAAVRIGEGGNQVTLPAPAWNMLVRYVKEGVLSAL